MKINQHGVHFTEYRYGRPGSYVSSFTDVDGGTLIIETETLIKMYELVKFDLEYRGEWDSLMKRMNESFISDMEKQ